MGDSVNPLSELFEQDAATRAAQAELVRQEYLAEENKQQVRLAIRGLWLYREDLDDAKIITALESRLTETLNADEEARFEACTKTPNEDGLITYFRPATPLIPQPIWAALIPFHIRAWQKLAEVIQARGYRELFAALAPVALLLQAAVRLATAKPKDISDWITNGMPEARHEGFLQRTLAEGSLWLERAFEARLRGLPLPPEDVWKHGCDLETPPEDEEQSVLDPSPSDGQQKPEETQVVVLPAPNDLHPADEAIGATPVCDEKQATTKKRVSISKAIVVLVDHPDWTNEQIAAKAGCHPNSLSNNKKFKATRAAIKASGKQEMRRAKSRGGSMDEYEDEVEDEDDSEMNF